MRLLGDLGTLYTGNPKILQMEKTPPLLQPVSINGKFIVPIIEGTNILVDPSSYILPVDGGDVCSESYAGLLAQFPMFEWIYFNPLLTPANIAEFDLTGGISNFRVRAQVGPAPNNVVILPENDAIAPPREGLLITELIDISPQVPAGVDEFMVYWKIYGMEFSHDVLSDWGIFAGENNPTIKSIKEVDQEPPGFVVKLSNDDGNSWKTVGHLEHSVFLSNDTRLRLKFENHTPERIYLASYAIMF
jgi:hypothetical protein